jgi:hypothetical protein
MADQSARGEYMQTQAETVFPKERQVLHWQLINWQLATDKLATGN